MSEPLARFRATLRQEHALLEQTPPFGLLAADSVDIAAYGAFLSVMQAFYADLEIRLPAAIAAQGEALGHCYVCRLPALQGDLAALALPPAVGAALPLPLDSADDVLGVLYVIEGSSHGARQLRGQLRASLAGTSAAFAFLDLLAEQTLAAGAWEKLLWQLQQRLSDEAGFARIVAAASATFVALRQLASSLMEKTPVSGR